MAYQLNEKLSRLQPYVPVAETAGIIHLDANESFLNLPETLRQKISEAVAQTSYHRYPDPYAVELCKAFAAYYHVKENHVTAGNGSDELISLLISNFLMKGETVVTTDPDFSMYTFYPALAETNCMEICKGNNFSISSEDLICKVQELHARMLLFSNPCNPTSLGLTKQQILQIVKNVDALVVIDEAYMDFWDLSQSVLGEEENYDNLIVLKTCSKIGVAAIRLGFAVSNEKLTGILHAVKSPYNVNTLTQKIGSLFLQAQDVLRSRTKAIQTSRDALQNGVEAVLQRHPGAFQLYRSCTNFVTLRLPRADALHTYLMAHGISVRLFPGFLRVTAGSETENAAFLSTLEAYLEEEN